MIGGNLYQSLYSIFFFRKSKAFGVYLIGRRPAILTHHFNISFPFLDRRTPFFHSAGAGFNSIFLFKKKNQKNLIDNQALKCFWTVI